MSVNYIRRAGSGCPGWAAIREASCQATDLSPAYAARSNTGSRMSRSPDPSISGTLPDLRAKASELFLEQMAILVLANHPDRLPPSQVSENIAAIAAMRHHKKLKALISDLRVAVGQFRQNFGVKISREQALSLVAWIQRNAEPSRACYLPAGMLADDLSMYAELKLPPTLG